MAVKKSELYTSIWKSCDELRGGMDASQYKDYVLVLLFVKYISDKYAGKPFAPIQVPEGGSFADMQAAKNKKNIGEELNTIIGKLAEANQLKGVIDNADFDDSAKLGDGKDKQDRLTNLIAIFENPALDFSQNRAADDDLLGDAYEYLMRNFATQSGKSKGQFYTPGEVSQVMAQIIGLENVTDPATTLYDPTCGSGSLLLRGADEVPGEVGGITIYGQEMDTSTHALAKMNMIIHGYASAVIERGNTLADPKFVTDGRLDTFDFALANPPFSSKSWSNGIVPEEDDYQRFAFGIPPKRNGDYAFLQHFIRSLRSTGKGAIILPHGVLFRGNAEATIRQNIVERGFIKGIIGLPANLFYGTGIPACIVVIDKEGAKARDGIFMMDASQGYVKDGNKNRLRYQDVHKIVDVFRNQIELPRYSRYVGLAEIADNDYNLNIPRYIDTTEPEDRQDIEAHLRGGLPARDVDALSDYWAVFPTLADDLFAATERDGYYDLRVPAEQVKTTIYEHPEFKDYSERVAAVYDGWRAASVPRLRNIQEGDTPKTVITGLAEDLLDRFDDVPLIDKYDVYQHLMLYWAETMQDDLYLLAADGWLGGNKILQMREIVERIDGFEARRAELDAELDRLDVAHGDKGGLLYDAKYAGRFTAKRVNKELKAARTAGTAEAARVMERCREIFTEREQQADLIAKARERLAALFEETMVPPALLIARYFPAEQAEIAALEADAEALQAEMDALEDEHGAEGGLLYEAKSDAGNLGKTSAKARLKQIKDDPDEQAEADTIREWLRLYKQQDEMSDAADAARAALHEKLLETYPTLETEAVQTLVIEDKWLAAIRDGVQNELERVTQRLTGRIQELDERYETTLPELDERAAAHHERVQDHLRRMGY